MAAYYNEIDKYAAQWLRNLIAKGLIADGEVDERSIVDVRPEDLEGFTQCHFFAGIGGWSIALKQAMWDDSRPVWTGSCPCQPFSSAGKQKAQQDERHLWPHWFRLIASIHPSVVFGEQVAGAIAHGWLDDAFDDLEREGYETAAAILPACSVGAPHKRDRLWFVANSKSIKSSWVSKQSILRQPINETSANSDGIGCEGGSEKPISGERKGLVQSEREIENFNNGWDISSPKLCGVDDGIFARTSKLRAYGNAIVPQVATEFIKAYMEKTNEQ